MIATIAKKIPQGKLFFKIFFVLFLILLLMIPNSQIQGLISERQSMERFTQQDIAASWGPNQTIIGPILSIPFTKEIPTKDGESTRHDYILRVLPKTLHIDVDLQTQERKKSIYKAILYSASHELTGVFEQPDFSKFGKYVSDIHWANASLDFEFTSSRSLDKVVYVDWNSEKIKMQAGASGKNIFYNSSIHSSVPMTKDIKEYHFKASISIHGSEAINYMPLAENSSLSMKSDWTAPGFIGLPLPSERKITESGFTANWKLTEYNRTFKNIWIDGEDQHKLRQETFGVDLIQTLGHYQKNMRSAKYALLIISLSFLVFFFFEMLKGKRIHFVQYIFVGLALSIFYILLLSFSEHIGFDMAYLVSGVSVVGLISWYSRYILYRDSNVLILTSILSGLYLYIYILLQMEEFALLVGSLGLFTVLAITMYLSRHFDWYNLSSSVESEKEMVLEVEDWETI